MDLRGFALRTFFSTLTAVSVYFLGVPAVLAAPTLSSPEDARPAPICCSYSDPDTGITNPCIAVGAACRATIDDLCTNDSLICKEIVGTGRGVCEQAVINQPDGTSCESMGPRTDCCQPLAECDKKGKCIRGGSVPCSNPGPDPCKRYSCPCNVDPPICEGIDDASLCPLVCTCGYTVQASLPADQGTALCKTVCADVGSTSSSYQIPGYCACSGMPLQKCPGSAYGKPFNVIGTLPASCIPQLDCQVGAWEPAIVPCGTIITQTRQITQPQLGGGAACPALSQTVTGPPCTCQDQPQVTCKLDDPDTQGNEYVFCSTGTDQVWDDKVVRPGAPQRCSGSVGSEYYSCMMKALAADLCKKSTGATDNTVSSDTVSGSYRCVQWPLSNPTYCPKDCVVSGWSAAPVPCTPGTTYKSSPTISQQPEFGGAACPGTETKQCPDVLCITGVDLNTQHRSCPSPDSSVGYHGAGRWYPIISFTGGTLYATAGVYTDSRCSTSATLNGGGTAEVVDNSAYDSDPTDRTVEFLDDKRSCPTIDKLSSYFGVSDGTQSVCIPWPGGTLDTPVCYTVGGPPKKDCVVSGWSAAPVPCTPGTTYTSSPTISQQPAFGGAACPGAKTEKCPTPPPCGNGILETGEQCDTGNGSAAGCTPGCKCVGCKLECDGVGCKTLARVKCYELVSGEVKCDRITAWGPSAKYTDPSTGAVTNCADENCCPHNGTDTTNATRRAGVGVCLSLESACPSNPGRPTDPNSFFYSHSTTTSWAKCLTSEDSCMPGLKPACGNNVLEDAEACDGSVPPGACPAGKNCSCNSCKLEWCGDGLVNNGEACDGGPDCSAECTKTSGGGGGGGGDDGGGGGGGGGAQGCACSYNLTLGLTPDAANTECATTCRSIGATSAGAQLSAGYCSCGGVPYSTCPSQANGKALNTMVKSYNPECYPSDPCPIDSKGCINYCASRGGRGDPTCKSTWIGPSCGIKCVPPQSRPECPKPPSDVGFCDEKCNCLENGA